MKALVVLHVIRITSPCVARLTFGDFLLLFSFMVPTLPKWPGCEEKKGRKMLLLC